MLKFWPALVIPVVMAAAVLMFFQPKRAEVHLQERSFQEYWDDLRAGETRKQNSFGNTLIVTKTDGTRYRVEPSTEEILDTFGINPFPSIRSRLRSFFSDPLVIGPYSVGLAIAAYFGIKSRRKPPPQLNA